MREECTSVAVVDKIALTSKGASSTVRFGERSGDFTIKNGAVAGQDGLTVCHVSYALLLAASPTHRLPPERRPRCPRPVRALPPRAVAAPRR